MLTTSCLEAAGLAPYFEPNAGQAPAQAAFVGRLPGHTVFLRHNGDAVHFRHSAPPGEDPVIMMLVGASHRPAPLAGLALDSVTRFYSGSPDVWKPAIPHYQGVTFAGVYGGVDLAWQASEGDLEFRFYLRPASDPTHIRFRFAGAREVALENGALFIYTTAGGLHYRRPSAWQEVNGGRVPVEIEYRLEEGIVGFTTGPLDARYPLVIDPVVRSASYLGGAGFDAAHAVTVDGAGAVYLAGETGSGAFTGRSGSTGAGTNRAAFVSKLSADGSKVLFTTILGAGGNTSAKAVAIDASGNIWVAGVTAGLNFPATATAVQRTSGGAEDAFVARLDASGVLAYGTYLGGGGSDGALAMALDSSGNAYLTGYTGSFNFPTTPGVPQRMNQGGFFDAFVVKLKAFGAELSYSGLLGGTGNDQGRAIAVDATGNACIAGSTDSRSLPVQAAAQGQLAGNSDALAGCLNGNGTGWTTLTYLGGSGPDEASAIAIDAAGFLLVGGSTFSPNFPATAGSYRTSWSGEYDGFVARISRAGGGPAFASYLGGSGSDAITAIRTDASGLVWLAGYTGSPDFPRDNRSPFRGYFDAFLAAMQPDGTALVSASLFGGAGDDRALTLALLPTGELALGGLTQSVDFPSTPGSALPAQPGNYSAFMVRVAPDAVPAPVSASAAPTGGRSMIVTVAVDHTGGLSDIADISVRVSASATGAGVCQWSYKPGTNALQLWNDAGTAVAGTVTPGSSASVSNSQCTLKGTGSGVAFSGVHATLQASLDFNAGYAGAKNIYVTSTSLGGVASGWRSLGTTAIAGNSAPQVASVTASGAGASALFTVVVSDGDGAADLAIVYFLVDRILSGVNACFLSYDPKVNRLSLMSDAGPAWLPSATPGSAGALANSQCVVDLPASSAVFSGATLTLRVRLSFSAPFGGTKVVYAYAADTIAASGWYSFGNWIVPGNTAPRLTSVSGTGVSSDTALFTTGLADDNTHSDVQVVYLLVDRRLSGIGSCFLVWLRNNNTLTLMNDAGTAWLNSVVVGSGASVANSQCTVQSGGSSVGGSGTAFSLTISIRFAASFGGVKAVYVHGNDFSFASTGWLRVGELTIPGNVPPRVISITGAATGDGRSAVFTGVVSDDNGVLDVETVYFLVDRALVGINACFVAYNRTTAAMTLMNDAGSAWLSPVRPGTAQSSSNAQCTLEGAMSSAVDSGGSVTLRFGIRFQAAFSGVKQAYINAMDSTSATLGWVSAGAWTIP